MTIPQPATGKFVAKGPLLAPGRSFREAPMNEKSTGLVEAVGPFADAPLSPEGISHSPTAYELLVRAGRDAVWYLDGADLYVADYESGVAAQVVLNKGVKGSAGFLGLRRFPLEGIDEELFTQLPGSAVAAVLMTFAASVGDVVPGPGPALPWDGDDEAADAEIRGMFGDDHMSDADYQANLRDSLARQEADSLTDDLEEQAQDIFAKSWSSSMPPAPGVRPVLASAGSRVEGSPRAAVFLSLRGDAAKELVSIGEEARRLSSFRDSSSPERTPHAAGVLQARLTRVLGESTLGPAERALVAACGDSGAREADLGGGALGAQLNNIRRQAEFALRASLAVQTAAAGSLAARSVSA